MKRTSSFPALVFFVIVMVGLALAYILNGGFTGVGGAIVLGASLVIGAIAANAVQVAAAWDRAVVLRLGRFRALRGPGLFGIIPIIDTIPYWIDTRVISAELQRIIDLRTEPWGVHVNAVEVRDVLIPSALEDAMSMQAQAERERQARVILGDSERQVAEKFGEAAKTYAHDPVAMHLRAMNMLYEGLKQNSTIVVVPSSALESMQLGGLAGITALTMGLGRDGAVKETAVASH